MKKIIVYYGPKHAFNRMLDFHFKSLAQLVAEHEAKGKIYTHIHRGEDGSLLSNTPPPEKERIENLAAYSEEYSGITESAVESFIRIVEGYEIDNFYLQNPPASIFQQLERSYPDLLEIIHYEYKKLSKGMFFKIEDTFSEHIIGQENVKRRLLASLYPILKSKKRKPVVIMFYGNSGIGKTETAKFLSKILGHPLFRKQFSMFHSVDFQSYLFGGDHSQSCFARDLLERESNIILLDEFDKPNPIFHNAFYQLFDEGVFEDKNYKVEMFNSVIICTSNYQSETEIQKNLGDPIFFRFDKFIKFEKLSNESIEKIIDSLLDDKYKKLTPTDRRVVNKEYIKNKLILSINRISNVRQISSIIDEYFSIQIVERLLKSRSRK